MLKYIGLLSCFSCLPLFLWAQNDTIVSDSLYYLGKDLYYEGQYEEALKNFEPALVLRRKIYGEEHIQIRKAHQQIGKANMRLRRHTIALQAFEKALTIAQKVEAPESNGITDLYTQIGNTYSQMYDPEQSNFYYQKLIDIFTKQEGAESVEVGKVYMNQGLNSLKMYNYRQAEQDFQKAFNCFQKSSTPKSKEFYRIYSNYALLLQKRGEYEQALAYTKQALEIKLLHYDSMHPSVAKYHMNLGMIYESLGQLEASLACKKKCLAIDRHALGDNHPETGGAYGELADAYNALGQLDTALQLYQRAIKIQEKTLDPTHTYIMGGYFEMGQVYEEQKNYPQAFATYQEILDRAYRRSYVPKSLLADTYRRIAKLHFAQEDLSQALQTINQALQTVAPRFKNNTSDPQINPSLAQITIPSKGFKLLKTKSKILQAIFNQDQQTQALRAALQASELAIQLIDQLKQGYQSADAKKFLNYRTVEIYELAVAQAFQMYRLTNDGAYLYKAFQFSEKSKASILWQTVNDSYALERSSISPEKLAEMKKLEQQIASLEKEERTDEPSPGKRKIFELKRVYRNLIKGLEKENPQYYALKYASSEIDLAVLQAQLPSEQTVLVEYFYSEQKIYTFVISKEGFQAYEAPLPTQLLEKIFALRGKNINAILWQKTSTENYITQLNDLHELLIAPLKTSLQAAQHLIVIPHGILQFLSFESLAPKATEADFRTLDYLIKNYDLQYAWSAALWSKRTPRQTSTEYPFVGFALDFKSTEMPHTNTFAQFRKTTEVLHNAIPEVEAANDYFTGKIFVNAQASKRQFLQIAPQSNIIHLATHAIANDRFPKASGLLFSNDLKEEDSFLDITEIYKMKLSAKLAVMSACNTGYGQLEEGEGAMSLGRAFLYAGCQSVIMSLWLANDQSTSNIMQAFYKYAAQGLSKHEALRKAKIDYLTRADPLTAHPYFWANLVAVGDMSPLMNSYNIFGWLAAILTLLLLGVWWWRKTSG